MNPATPGNGQKEDVSTSKGDGFQKWPGYIKFSGILQLGSRSGYSEPDETSPKAAEQIRQGSLVRITRTYPRAMGPWIQDSRLITRQRATCWKARQGWMGREVARGER